MTRPDSNPSTRLDREQTRRDAVTRLRGVVASVPDGFRDEDGVWHDGPLRQRARDALDALLAELEQAERERDEAREQLGIQVALRAENIARLAKVPALVEALREVELGPRVKGLSRDPQAIARDALTAWEQE